MLIMIWLAWAAIGVAICCMAATAFVANPFASGPDAKRAYRRSVKMLNEAGTTKDSDSKATS